MALLIPRPSFPPKRGTLVLWRRAHGLSRQDVAARMGLSGAWVQVIEDGRLSWSTNRKQFERYCDAVEAAHDLSVGDAEAAARLLDRVESGEDLPKIDGRVRLQKAEADLGPRS